MCLYFYTRISGARNEPTRCNLIMQCDLHKCIYGSRRDIHTGWLLLCWLLLFLLFDNVGEKRSVSLTKQSGAACFKNSCSTPIKSCCYTVLLTIVTILYIRPAELPPLITESLYPWTNSSYFPHSLAPGYHCALCFYELDFFRLCV